MTVNTRIKPEGNIFSSWASGQNGAPDMALFGLTDGSGNLYKVTDNGDGTCSLNVVSSGAAGTPITAASGNVAAASAIATLAGTAGKTTYITGFELTAAGATGAAVVIATVVGVITGTLSYIFVFPAGATLAAQPLIVDFPQPIPASAANTAIVVTLPSGGTGNTNAAAVAHGFQL